MKCIICQKKFSGSGDCCKKCRKQYTVEEIDRVRAAKHEAEMAKLEFEMTLAAANATIEAQRKATRELWDALNRAYVERYFGM